MSIFLPLVVGALTQAAPTDPYFANVELLLHGEGTNGSTTLVDSSGSPKTVTASGSTISTAQFKFGAASILGALSPNGAASYFTATIGAGGTMTGDFTWESWVHGGSNNVVFFNGGTANDNVYLYNGQLKRTVAGIGSNIVAITTNVSSAWHHLAISRTGSTIKGFTDGAEIGSATDSSTIDLQTLICGKYVPNNNLVWQGYYDDMRVTKGVGRYTAAFSVPARQFPDS